MRFFCISFKIDIFYINISRNFYYGRNDKLNFFFLYVILWFFFKDKKFLWKDFFIVRCRVLGIVMEVFIVIVLYGYGE